MEASNFPETPAIVNGQVDHGVDYPLVDNNTNTVHGNGNGNRHPVFDCPPGYRFCPSDEELIVDYLLKRAAGLPLSVQDRVIDVNLYKYNPEFLSERYKRPGEDDCYFFTSRERKYRNGTRPNRAAGDGFWKATGVDKPIVHKNKTIGYRKALVFYKGKPPNHDGKTNWVMHEFRLNQPPRSKANPNDMRLDDFVLCRIYKTSGKPRKRKSQTNDNVDDLDDDNSPVYDNQDPNINDLIDANHMFELPGQPSLDQYFGNDMPYDASYGAPPPSVLQSAAPPPALPFDGTHLQRPPPPQSTNNSFNYYADVFYGRLGSDSGYLDDDIPEDCNDGRPW